MRAFYFRTILDLQQDCKDSIENFRIPFTLSDFPCVWWYWQFWRVLVRYLVECLFTGIGLTFLSWGDGFCRERPPREIATVVRSHQGYLTISMTGDVDHVTWLRRRMSGISLSFLSPLEGSQCVRADLQTGTYSPLLWGWVICRSYSEFLCAADVFILHYLFISVWYTLVIIQ